MHSAPLALLTTFLPFAVSTSFTPGPNNLMLANSGARFGFRRSIPLQSGVVLGFAAMNFLVGIGVAQIVIAVPVLFTAMKVLGVAYFVHLAWKIATAESAKPGVAPARPMSFLRAAAFQWINPKAWIMAVGAVATYTTRAFDLRLQVLLITLTFAVVGVASTATWALFGQAIRRYLTTRPRRIAFNATMAALLLLSVIPIVIELV